MKGRFAGLVVALWSLACAGGDTPPDVVTEAPPAASPAAPDATPAAATATRCPEGVTNVPTWQGEYPGPPVDVKQAVKLPARAQVCDAEAKLTCEVKPGLYHPWSSMPTVASFATLRPIEHWKLRRAGVIDGVRPEPFDAGTTIDVLAYMGEGFCDMTIAGAEANGPCPSMLSDEQGELAEQLPSVTYAEVQAMQVPCTDGSSAWIDVDDALFTHPEVKQGGISEYGKVDPAP